MLRRLFRWLVGDARPVLVVEFEVGDGYCRWITDEDICGIADSLSGARQMCKYLFPDRRIVEAVYTHPSIRASIK